MPRVMVTETDENTRTTYSNLSDMCFTFFNSFQPGRLRACGFVSNRHQALSLLADLRSHDVQLVYKDFKDTERITLNDHTDTAKHDKSVGITRRGAYHLENGCFLTYRVHVQKFRKVEQESERRVLDGPDEQEESTAPRKSRKKPTVSISQFGKVMIL